MKKQKTKVIAIAILLSLGFLATANESKRKVTVTTERQKAVVLQLDNIEEGTEISIRDNEGKILFQDQSNAKAYGKIFNLSLMKKGELQLEIENNSTLEIMSIQVTEEAAWLKPEAHAVFQKPIVKHNDELMKIYFGEEHSGMKIKVIDQYGSITLRDKVDSKDKSLRRYDISKLQSGKYNIQFTADGRSFYHTITLD